MTESDITIKKPDDCDVLKFHVESLDEYHDLVERISYSWREAARSEEDQDDYFPGELSPWFRGITQARYKIEPGLLRKNNGLLKEGEHRKTRRVRKIEEYLLRRFQVLGAPFLENNLPKEALHWLFVMQHHGVKTRLLDWSLSSMIALLFAVRKFDQRAIRNPTQRESKFGNRMDDRPAAAVWMLEPRRLSRECGFGRKIPVFGIDIAAEGKDAEGKDVEGEDAEDKDTSFARTLKKLELYRTLELEGINLGTEGTGTNNSYPIPIIPEPVSTRLTSQSGRFTFHTNEREGLKSFAAKNKNRWYLVKMIFPFGCHRRILRALRTAGISEIPITHDLDGVAKEVTRSLKLSLDEDTSSQPKPRNTKGDEGWYRITKENEREEDREEDEENEGRAAR